MGKNRKLQEWTQDLHILVENFRPAGLLSRAGLALLSACGTDSDIQGQEGSGTCSGQESQDSEQVKGPKWRPMLGSSNNGPKTLPSAQNLDKLACPPTGS